MIGDLALGVHIAAGAAGLAIGPIVIRHAARSAARGRSAEHYHWLVAVVCLSAVVLAALDWSRLWLFVPIAVTSYALAFVGRLAARRGWRQAHIRGHGGAYIALLTALLVVSFTSLPVLWLLPTAIGAPMLHLLSHRADVGTAFPEQRHSGSLHDRSTVGERLSQHST